ncbi:MAG: membrane-associated phospholipid phosphatase [Flavobacteriales bacterium]|jgi:membrane-associated phospholipid phosphatase
MKLIVAIFLLASLSTAAQYSAYEPTKEWIKSGTTLVLFGGAQLIKYNVAPLTLGEIELLQVNQVNGFDRRTAGLWSPGHAKASDILMMASYAFPLSIAAFPDARKQWKTVGHLYFQTAVVTIALTETIKALVHRTRPYVYNDNVATHHKTERDARFSFVSGHTSTVAANCFLTASMYAKYSSNSLGKTLVWTGAALYPLLVGYMRIRAGKHFTTDVIGGYILGASLGLTMPWILQKISSKSN